MARRGSSEDLNAHRTSLSDSKIVTHDRTEKELSYSHFNAVDYGYYKHSVDHTITNVESRDSTFGQSSSTGNRRSTGLISPIGYPEAITHREELPGDHPPKNDIDHAEHVTKPRRIWGVERRWFIAAVIAAGLVVAAVVAGVTGGLLRDRHGGMQATKQNLAAANWTVNDVEYQIVFTQDGSDGSLLAYVKTVESWTQINISSCFDDSALPIRSQSPLAAVAMSDSTDFDNPDVNQLRVYFASPGHYVVEIITHSPNLTDWSWGILGPHTNHTLEMAETSQLAATWRRCLNETICGHGQIFLTYELDNALMVANSTANWDPSIAVDRIDPLSGITLMSVQTLKPFTDSVSLNATDYAWAIYKDAGRVATAWQDFQYDWSWTDKSKVITGMPPPENSTLQTLAAAAFDDRRHVLLVGLGDTNGTAFGNHFDPVEYLWVGAQRLKLQGVPATTEFSTVAMTADARLYGISDGVIQEYEMDQTDIYTFYFKGDVSNKLS
ncbi:hypothetical protein F4679DRAFT_592173 [Xylaria curta]|nr:hypothetical protein F4679DRAFT_592173 [Xylaria curta]